MTNTAAPLTEPRDLLAEYRPPISNPLHLGLIMQAHIVTGVIAVAAGVFGTAPLAGGIVFGLAFGGSELALRALGAISIAADPARFTVRQKMLFMVAWTAITLVAASLLGALAYSLFVGPVSLSLILKMIVIGLATGSILSLPRFYIDHQMATIHLQMDRQARTYREALAVRREQADHAAEALRSSLKDAEVRALGYASWARRESQAAQEWAASQLSGVDVKTFPVFTQMKESQSALLAIYTSLHRDRERSDVTPVGDRTDRLEEFMNQFQRLMVEGALPKYVFALLNPHQQPLPLQSRSEKLAQIHKEMGKLSGEMLNWTSYTSHLMPNQTQNALLVNALWEAVRDAVASLSVHLFERHMKELEGIATESEPFSDEVLEIEAQIAPKIAQMRSIFQT